MVMDLIAHTLQQLDEQSTHDGHGRRGVGQDSLLIPFLAKERVWKGRKLVDFLLLAAPYQQCSSTAPFKVLSSFLDFLYLIIPHCLSDLIECRLEERADPVELSAVDGKLAFRFVPGVPMLAIALRTAVEDFRLFAVLVNAVSTASTLMSTRPGTVCALLVRSRDGGNWIDYSEIRNLTGSCGALVDRGGL